MHPQAGMERKDVMSKNVTIYRHQAEALAKHASKDVKVGQGRLARPGRTHVCVAAAPPPIIVLCHALVYRCL